VTDAPPAVADFRNTGFPRGIVLEEIRRGHERQDLAEFELYGCTAEFLDFKRARQLKAREIVSGIFGVHAIHRKFQPTCLNCPI
jgi:hypothetical protein